MSHSFACAGSKLFNELPLTVNW